MRTWLGIVMGIALLAAATAAQVPTPAAAEFPPTGTPGAVVSRTIEFPSKILKRGPGGCSSPCPRTMTARPKPIPSFI